MARGILILCTLVFSLLFIIVQKFEVVLRSKYLIILLAIFENIFVWMIVINHDDPKESFINNLMAKMTLDEKIGQFNLRDAHTSAVDSGQCVQNLKSIENSECGGLLNVSSDMALKFQDAAVKGSRLGIPLLYGLDVIHGYATIFSILIAQSCSWDTLGIRRIDRIVEEGCSSDGTNWFLSPMLDICRDACWGKIMEEYGEDPFLTSCFAKVIIGDYQENLKTNTDVDSLLQTSWTLWCC